MSQSAAMVPLSRTLKMEKIDAHKAGEGKTAESFQVFNSTVDDVVEKWLIMLWVVLGAIRMISWAEKNGFTKRECVICNSMLTL